MLAALIVLPAAAGFHAGVAAPRPSLAAHTTALPHAHARAAAPRLDFGGPKYKMDAEQGEGERIRVVCTLRARAVARGSLHRAFGAIRSLTPRIIRLPVVSQLRRCHLRCASLSVTSSPSLELSSSSSASPSSC